MFQWCGTYNGDVEITKSDKPLLVIVIVKRDNYHCVTIRILLVNSIKRDQPFLKLARSIN